MGRAMRDLPTFKKIEVKMNPINVLNCRTRQEFRTWIETHGSTESECWVRISRKSGGVEGVVSYIDLVEEALCFGWIDGIQKKLDEGEAFSRLTPRRPRSNWTELNKERCRRLIRLGLMHERGRAVLPPDVENPSFEIPEWIARQLQADPQLWEQVLAQPPLYRRVRLSNIDQYRGRKLAELAQQKLERYMAYTRAGKLYGEWHDQGRLL